MYGPNAFGSSNMPSVSHPHRPFSKAAPPSTGHLALSPVAIFLRKALPTRGIKYTPMRLMEVCAYFEAQLIYETEELAEAMRDASFTSNLPWGLKKVSR